MWAVVAVAGAVMVSDVLDGHVLLDIECLDRLYLSGYVPGLQTPGGVVCFLHDHRGTRSRPRRCSSRSGPGSG